MRHAFREQVGAEGQNSVVKIEPRIVIDGGERTAEAHGDRLAAPPACLERVIK